MTVMLSSVLLVAAATGAWIDARTGYLPDRLTLGALAALLTIATVQGVLVAAVAGACLAAGLLFALYAITRGRGLGLGDVKLAAAIGAGLGPAAACVALGCAFVIGACAAVLFIILRRLDRKASVPFGPYLACGIACAVTAHALGVL